MKTLYIECNMGAAGDMLMSALSELLPDPDGFVEKLGGIGIPNVTVEKERVQKCGVYGTHIKVAVGGEVEGEHMHEHKHEHEHSHEHTHHEHMHEHDHSHEHTHHEHMHEHHHHHHSGMSDIEHIIGNLDVSEKVRENALAVYKLIAEAESAAHGCPIEQIHFHEVGTMDAVTDIVGVCMLLEELAPDRIIVSPINTGSGQVRCAHGILPVPAPATAYILKDVPIYSNDVRGELCTPTGAALLKHFADDFSSMPQMCVAATGYGMGSKDFETANCLRAFIGDNRESGETDEVAELCCNLDDMTGEAISYAAEKLFEGGALDVFTTPTGMKKNRPAVLLSCLCRPQDKEKMAELIFKHTSTIGVRERLCKRYILKRQEVTVNTNYGEVRAKKSSGYGVEKVKPEYDELARLADENGVALSDIKIL